MTIETITTDQLQNIIYTLQPRGLFVTIENDKYIGCDNSAGDAWVEEFDFKEDCENWLLGKN